MIPLLVAIMSIVAPPPVANGRSAVRCAPYHGEEFILCAEGWKPQHGKLHRIEGCEEHRRGSQYKGPYGLGKLARRAGGGCDREAALIYLQARYGGDWSRAEAHHRRSNWY